MKYFLLLLVSLLFINHAFANDPIFDDYDEDGRKIRKPPTYHLYSDVNLISTKDVSYEKPKITIKSIFPQLEGFEEDSTLAQFNETVRDIIEYEIGNFKNKVVDQRAYLLNNSPVSSQRSELFIDYDASFVNAGRNRILSIRFSLQGRIGGDTHAYHFHRVLNYNLTTNEVIALSDLFQSDVNYMSILADYSRQALTKRFNPEEGANDSLLETADNYKNWNIKPNGIRFTFDQYSTNSTMPGTQTVLIPFRELKDISAADSPIAACIKNPNRCARNGVLTGGFIDEAANTHHRILNPGFSKL